MIGNGEPEHVLERHGASGTVLEELLKYSESRFRDDGAASSRRYPLADEPHVGAWEQYAEEARASGAAEVLRAKLVQLRFPIARGISSDPLYLASTRRGEPAPENARGVSFASPKAINISIHETPAGRIPIVVAEDRSDFVTLLQALTCRNEPREIPPAQGACMVAGYNNWDRIHAYRLAWERDNPGAMAHDWQTEFRRLIPRRERYQDRFILLSGGSYSGVPASRVGLTRDRWLEMSLAIRREHECVHYFTRRVLGSMSNSLHDELIADYVGITLALGKYRPDWFLRFMGLERFPIFRSSGRLRSYRGEPPLSDPAFRILQSMVVAAVRGVATLDPMGRTEYHDHTSVASAILQLAATPLLALVSVGAGDTEASQLFA